MAWYKGESWRQHIEKILRDTPDGRLIEEDRQARQLQKFGIAPQQSQRQLQRRPPNTVLCAVPKGGVLLCTLRERNAILAATAAVAEKMTRSGGQSRRRNWAAPPKELPATMRVDPGRKRNRANRRLSIDLRTGQTMAEKAPKVLEKDRHENDFDPKIHPLSRVNSQLTSHNHAVSTLSRVGSNLQPNRIRHLPNQTVQTPPYVAPQAAPQAAIVVRRSGRRGSIGNTGMSIDEGSSPIAPRRNTNNLLSVGLSVGLKMHFKKVDFAFPSAPAAVAAAAYPSKIHCTNLNTYPPQSGGRPKGNELAQVSLPVFCSRIPPTHPHRYSMIARSEQLQGQWEQRKAELSLQEGNQWSIYKKLPTLDSGDDEESKSEEEEEGKYRSEEEQPRLVRVTTFAAPDGAFPAYRRTNSFLTAEGAADLSAEIIKGAHDLP